MIDQELLRERDMEASYRLTVAWLRRARRERRGPPYLKIGRMVRYRRSDVEAWLANHAVLPQIQGMTQEANEE